MYADDLVILAPSHVGLSMLLSVCSDYRLEHDIKFNSAKSNIIIAVNMDWRRTLEFQETVIFQPVCYSGSRHQETALGLVSKNV